MSTWEVKSKSSNTQAIYIDAPYEIDVNYTENATTGTLTGISGQIYKGENRTYAGNFNGSINGEDINYTFNQVKLADMTNVITMVADIETIIKNENAGEE